MSRMAAWLLALAVLPRRLENRISLLGPPPPRPQEPSGVRWG